MFCKKRIGILLISAIVSSSFLPVFARPVRAQWVVSDPAHTAATIAQTTLTIADMAARALVQGILLRMVNSTVNWANSGFEGNPAYVVNPKQFFTDIADGVAGEYIMGTDLGFLCSPFQANIRLSLAQQYYEPQPFQCTLSQVTNNIEGFYNDFSQGGWDAWFSMTQNPVNNPYGAYLTAKVELDSRIASAIGLQKEQLDWNQGFLSWSECEVEDPDTGECLGRGPTKTPGSVIKSQLDKVLPANMERYINAQHLEDLIEAFVTGALNRFVFGPKGLFDRSDGGVPLPPPPPSPGEIPTITPTTSWSPPQTTNGWFPKLSPDGRYVGYGFGSITIADLETGTEYPFGPGFSGGWISPDTFTFMREINGETAERYEVTVGQWTAVKMNDDPALVGGNEFRAADGHWASWLASGSRLARDNQLLATGVGGALSISDNQTVYACDNDNSAICVRNGSVLSKTYTPKIPLFNTAIKNNYILYGGYGPVRGINPSGTDIDLRISSALNEGVGTIVFANGSPWVVTTAWEPQGNKTYIFLRPWGSPSIIAVAADAAYVSAAVAGNNFVIAYSSDVGRLTVVTIPVNSPLSRVNTSPVPPPQPTPQPTPPPTGTSKTISLQKTDFLTIPDGQGEDHFTVMFAGQSPSTRAKILSDLKSRGYTHIYLSPVNEGDFDEKNNFKQFNFYNQNPSQFKNILQEVVNAGLKPVVWLALDDAPTFHKDSAKKLPGIWDSFIPAIDPLVDSYVLGLESDEYWSRSEQDALGNKLNSLTNKPIFLHPGSDTQRITSWMDGIIYQWGGGNRSTQSITNTVQSLAPQFHNQCKFFIAGEYAYEVSESEAKKLGDAAMAAGADGFGNGATASRWTSSTATLSNCGGSGPPPVPPPTSFPGNSWPTATPESQGMSRAKLQAISSMNDAVVIKNGYEVWNWGNAGGSRGAWSSNTRSYLTTAWGMAIKDGSIPGGLGILDKPVKDLGTATARDFSSDILLRHLLSYTSCRTPPGSTWAYSCGQDWFDQYKIFKEVTGKTVHDYLNQKLMPVLGGSPGLEAKPDTTDDRGETNRIEGSPRDHARWGYLWMSQGRWNSQQLLDTAFVTQALQPRVSSPKGHGWSYPNAADEGFQIHLNRSGNVIPGCPTDAFAAAGGTNGRAFILAVPSQNLIVARHATESNLAETDANALGELRDKGSAVCQAVTG